MWIEKDVAALRREQERGTLDTGPDDDRRWFAANPHRNYRLRAPMKGETWNWEGDLTRASAVLVCQIKPGHRLRLMCDLSRAVSSWSTGEAAAKRLWEQASSKYPQTAEIERANRRIAAAI